MPSTALRLMIGDQAERGAGARAPRHSGPGDGGERYLIGLEFVNPGSALEQIDRIVAARLGQPSIPEA